MNETDIRKYAKLMQELGLTGLEITLDNNMVRLEREGHSQSNEMVQVNSTSEFIASEAKKDVDYTSIKSPLVGVFYSSPAENAESYVKTGASIKKGQTLCIVETMKLMNEIVAEYDGTILEICAVNGQIVEYGTELFRIKR